VIRIEKKLTGKARIRYKNSKKMVRDPLKVIRKGSGFNMKSKKVAEECKKIEGGGEKF
jgi:hypothetical protein